ncbi:hypothetical protein KUTeg_014717, partial [Tegillarca granosa]
MAGAQVQVKYVQTKRGHQSLVHNGYRYNVKFRRNDRTYWKCHLKTCSATVNTHNGIIVKFRHLHNHQPEHEQLKVNEILESIKKRCREEVVPVPTIYEEEVSKLRTPEWDDDMHHMEEQLPTFHSCKTSLYHQRENDEVQKLVRRAAVLPLIPSASVEDVWLNALESINEADIDINTTPFCDYVTEYWVENNRDIWNHFENEGPRKTNHLEGWHNKLKKQVRYRYKFNSLSSSVPLQFPSNISG